VNWKTAESANQPSWPLFPAEGRPPVTLCHCAFGFLSPFRLPPSALLPIEGLPAEPQSRASAAGIRRQLCNTPSQEVEVAISRGAVSPFVPCACHCAHRPKKATCVEVLHWCIRHGAKVSRRDRAAPAVVAGRGDSQSFGMHRGTEASGNGWCDRQSSGTACHRTAGLSLKSGHRNATILSRAARRRLAPRRIFRFLCPRVLRATEPPH
jgi:hypothetical protein